MRASRSAVARLLLARQGLLSWDGGRPWAESRRGTAGVLRTLRELEAIQLDPVAVVARNHHFVLLNRVADYRPALLEGVYAKKRVFEHWAQCRCVLPIEDWPLFESRRRQWAFDPGRDEKLASAADHIRAALRDRGPLPARALDSGHRVRSYWGFATKATSQAIEHLWESGEIVVAFRKDDERHYALAGAWLDGVATAPPLPGEEEIDRRFAKCLRAYRVVDVGHNMLGWAGHKSPARRQRWDRSIARGDLVPLEVEGVKRRYAVVREDVPLLAKLERARGVEPRATFLPPLDNLLWRRERVEDFFGFSYRWEIYVPPGKRKFGPYTLPILVGERFVARADLAFDRSRRKLAVRKLYPERTWTRDERSAVRRGLEELEGKLCRAAATA